MIEVELFWFAILALCFPVCFAPPVPCVYTASDGTYYNLSPLIVTTGLPYYMYIDGTKNYTFNICSDVTGDLVGTGKCPVGTAICQTELAPITLVMNFKSCGLPTDMTLSDSINGPAGGVTLRYGSGDTGCNGRERSMTMNILCAPGDELVVLNVSEPTGCTYTMFLQTNKACPPGGAVTATSGETTGATTDATTDATTGVTTDATSEATTGATSGATSDATTGPAPVATADATAGGATTATATTGGATPTTDTTTHHGPSSSTSGNDSDDLPDVHETFIGQVLIALVIGLGILFLVAALLAVREWARRRRAEKDTEMDRLLLTGSTYKDVKRRHLK